MIDRTGLCGKCEHCTYNHEIRSFGGSSKKFDFIMVRCQAMGIIKGKLLDQRCIYNFNDYTEKEAIEHLKNKRKRLLAPKDCPKCKNK